jgi:hypothetical protein
MIFTLANTNETLPLNRKYHYSISSWRPRNKTSPRYSKRGGAILGDGQVDARTITLDFSSGFKTDADFRAWANGLIRFFRQEFGPHYLIEPGPTGRRTRVTLQELPPMWDKGLEQRVVKSTVTLIMEDAVWEDENAIDDPWNGVSNGAQNTIDITDTFDDVYPVFTITALDDLAEFTLLNTSIGAGITVAHPGFVAGKEMIIDCSDEGSITVDNVDITASISEGGYLLLKPGANILEYQSSYGQANIQTSYRRVYGY